MKVLIVDDHPSDLHLLRTALVAEGWNVLEAPDGAAALNLLERDPVDLIISDVLMPNMDGYRFCYEVRHHPRLFELPFLIYSGTYKSADDKLLAGEMGVDGCVPKGNLSTIVKLAKDIVQQHPAHTLQPAEPEEQLHLVKSYSESLVQKLEEANAELARTMEHLRENEKRLRAIIQTEPECVKVADCNGFLMDVNPAGLAMLEADSIEQLRNVSLGDLVVPEYREEFKKMNGQVLEGKPGIIVLEVIGLKGTRRWLEMHAVPLPDGQGRNMLLSITRDITQRKNAENRIAVFSEMGQDLSSASTAREAAQIVAEVADKLLGWDACTIDLYLEEKDEVISLLAMDLMDGTRSEFSQNHTDKSPSERMRKVLRDGAQLILREPSNALPKDISVIGNKLRISASIMAVPIRNRTKDIGFLSIQSYTFEAYDQNDLQILQSLADHCAGALERIHAQQRLGQILATNPTVIYTLDVDGDNVLPSWVSENILELTGYTAFETCEPGWWENHLHPEEVQHVIQRRGQLFHQDQFSDEYQIRHRNGHYRWVQDHKKLIRNAKGKPVEIFGSLTDVTDRKTLQQQLRQAQKMKAIGQLAGGVAHDFNNLLTIMGGSVELLLWGEKNLSPESKHYLADIAAAANRASTLTRQLLTFSRQQTMTMQPIDLNEVIVGFTKMLRRILGEDIQVVNDFTRPLPLVDADTGMIEQVLMNLFVNARDAMPKGGTLKIRTERKTIDASSSQTSGARPGEFICLSVTDTGVGIAPEHLPRIFEPFFTTKDIGKGTGLGLATVYGIVEQHKGWIEVISAPEHGATFTVFLPISKAAASIPAKPSGEQALYGKEKILLVEDEPGVRELCQHILEHFGYTVFAADSGLSAKKVWARHHHEIDLLFTDMVMPGGLTGLELAELLQRQKPMLKIILTSGYSAQLLDTNISAKSIAFLQKPYSPTSVAALIRECLDKR